MHEIPFDGELKIGHNVEIGYFAQNQAMLLDENLTVHDTIDYAATGEIRTRINDILGAFMFGGAASEKKVKAPSSFRGTVGLLASVILWTRVPSGSTARFAFSLIPVRTKLLAR